MKNLIAILVLVLVSVSAFSNKKDQRRLENTDKAAVSISDNYQPVTMRTYYLEVTRLTKSDVTYSQFKENLSLIQHDDYKIEVVNGKAQAFKNFKTVWIHNGEDIEVVRISKNIK